MPVIYSPLQNLSETDLPIIGSLANAMEPNCLKMALNNSSDQLYAGDPVAVLVTKTGDKIYGANHGVNPNTQTITKKATTTNTGANDTAVCGFMTFNAVDRVADGGVPLPVKGELVNYAPLGMGVLIWLEVASDNQAGFQANLDTNVALTIDSVNGGVKVGSGADILVGAKLVQGLTKCRKVSANGIEDAVGVLVQLD